MVHETIQGTFRQTNLANESAECLAKREELRLAEIELMRQRERVAELRCGRGPASPPRSPARSSPATAPIPASRRLSSTRRGLAPGFAAAVDLVIELDAAHISAAATRWFHLRLFAEFASLISLTDFAQRTN